MNKYTVFWLGMLGGTGVIVFVAMQKIRARVGQNIYHETQTRAYLAGYNRSHYRINFKIHLGAVKNLLENSVIGMFWSCSRYTVT